MEIEIILKYCIFFIIGFLSANILGYYVLNGMEMPVLKDFGSVIDNNSAPSNFIGENQIEIYDDRVVINVKDASLSRYAATGSMKPVLDENSNGIRVKPFSESDISVGDIITFQQDNNLIVHRVIEIGEDEQGVYFITKGDNNSMSDGKKRFKDIRYITIALIY